MIRLHALPLLPPLQRHTGRLRKTGNLLTGEEGRGRGAESYDRKKAWPSLNHSILSVPGEPRWRAGEIWRTAGRTLDFPLYVLFVNAFLSVLALYRKRKRTGGPIKYVLIGKERRKVKSYDWK
jgi:hypothetical protein